MLTMTVCTTGVLSTSGISCQTTPLVEGNAARLAGVCHPSVACCKVTCCIGCKNSRWSKFNQSIKNLFHLSTKGERGWWEKAALLQLDEARPPMVQFDSVQQ